jgi:hypothetical protein
MLEIKNREDFYFFKSKKLRTNSKVGDQLHDNRHTAEQWPTLQA